MALVIINSRYISNISLLEFSGRAGQAVSAPWWWFSYNFLFSFRIIESETVWTLCCLMNESMPGTEATSAYLKWIWMWANHTAQTCLHSQWEAMPVLLFTSLHNHRAQRIQWRPGLWPNFLGASKDSPPPENAEAINLKPGEQIFNTHFLEKKHFRSVVLNTPNVVTH